MLLKEIEFNENHPAWTNNRDFNIMFLNMVERHLNDTIKKIGYIYLNQIYERLGIRWNPEDENLCVKYNNADQIWFIQFEVFVKSNNSILIHVHSYK